MFTTLAQGDSAAPPSAASPGGFAHKCKMCLTIPVVAQVHVDLPWTVVGRRVETDYVALSTDVHIVAL